MTENQILRLIQQGGYPYCEITYDLKKREWYFFKIVGSKKYKNNFENFVNEINHDLGVAKGEFDRRVISLNNLKNQFREGPFDIVSPKNLTEYTEIKGNIEYHLEEWRIKWEALEKLRAVVKYLQSHPEDLIQEMELNKSNKLKGRNNTQKISSENDISEKLDLIHSVVVKTAAEVIGKQEQRNSGGEEIVAVKDKSLSEKTCDTFDLIAKKWQAEGKRIVKKKIYTIIADQEKCDIDTIKQRHVRGTEEREKQRWAIKEKERRIKSDIK